MKIDATNTPALVLDFLDYHRSARNHSENTIRGYALDLSCLVSVLLERHGLGGSDRAKVDADLFRSATLEDLYAYQIYSPSGAPLAASSRCRRTSSVKSFFHYLTVKRHLLDKDLSLELDMPKRPASLPRYLVEEECVSLLESGSGANTIRDNAILTLFISCGLRVSELVGLNVADIRADSVRVRGKGSKERVVYFGESCRKALSLWLLQRESVTMAGGHEDALFISRNHKRISTRAVQDVVKSRLESAGLDPERYSAHKLRHTCATLMLKNGVDTRVLQEVLGHSSLTTTQIYAHVESGSLRAAAMANPIGA